MSALCAAAYGLRLAGAPDTPWLAVRGAGHWPVMTIEPDGNGEPLVDVHSLRARVAAGTDLGELVHPLLSSLATRVALARGLDGMHAGAVCGRDGVWVLPSPKEAGKTTLLAACASAGFEVLTDDILVFDGERCFAGPRCLDLRDDAAARFGPTEPVRTVAPRRRLTLPPVDAEQPLAGFLHIGWGERHELAALSPVEALRRLMTVYETEAFTSDRSRLLDFAGLPAFELRRPRSLASLEDTVALLERELCLR